MAERRMFAKTIIDSDTFLDMSLSTQALYFHLSMRADDDGFINNPKKIQRMIGASEDDLKLLIAKNFIIPFETGIVVIKHWKIHNYIRSDRYKPSMFKEKELVKVDSQSIYQPIDSTDTNGIPTDNQTVYQMDTQDRLGKESIVKDSIVKDSIVKDNILLSVSTDTKQKINYENIMNLFNSVCVSLPKIRNLTDLRKQKIRKANKELNGDFENFFKRIENSDFLTGKNGSWNGCNFDWIFKPQNLIKIIEGNYDNKIFTPIPQSSTSAAVQAISNKPIYGTPLQGINYDEEF
ncbi:MAG: hypothetical protein UE295_00095 [Acutalibacteraceae bacterium]|nr:hypothetical protein [Acutalibacteraceae bacterium]